MRKQDIAPKMAELWEMLPESTRQSGRAEIVLRQAFLDWAHGVPEKQMPPLRREFDRCLAQYVTPTPPRPIPAPEPPARPAKRSEDEIFEELSRAALGCFNTTVDGSVERADYLAGLARAEGRRILRQITRNPLKRRRLMQRLEREIARERANVIT